jgi:hypothetical protein
MSTLRVGFGRTNTFVFPHVRRCSCREVVR